MDHDKDNSTRIVVDLQACQAAGYYQRGIGNYSLGLFSQLAKICAPAELFTLFSDALPHEISHPSIDHRRRLDLRLDTDWQAPGDFEGGNLDSLASIAYSATYQSVKPDILHVSHNFLDCRDRVALPVAVNPAAGQLLSTTLYDLIPLRFPDHYLADETARRRYLFQLQQLRRYDLLFAISESTRRDAIDLLGIEGSRIVTIHGGVEEHFCGPIDRIKARHALDADYAIRQKLLVYTGGDDFRKNIDGLIDAFATLSVARRATTTLAIIGNISLASQEAYFNLAKRVGLSPDDLLFTGYVDDLTLVNFYQACDAFVFPSLYEGLGLPVLEAMNCGAPVIGGNNSSIKELISFDDALFDADSSPAIGSSIERVLGNREFADQLRSVSAKQAPLFTWERSANLVNESYNEFLNANRELGVSLAMSNWQPRNRLAMLTPLPPSQSGIADYSSDFLPFLSRHFEIDIYLFGHRTDDLQISASFRIFDASTFALAAPSYDAILYEIGNSDFHTHMLDLMLKFPGIATLHDAYMGGILAHMEFSLNQPFRYQAELLYSHGPAARQTIAPNPDDRELVAKGIDRLPITKRILDNALGVVSHSSFNLKVAREHYPQGWLAPYRTIAQLMFCRSVEANSVSKLRAELGLPDNAFIIASFGHVVWTKCGDQLLQAFLDSQNLQAANAYLLFVGKLSNDDFGKSLNKQIKTSSAHQRIRVTGFISGDDYQKYLSIANVSVQLRSNSRGGTPRSVLDCMAHGLPVILNDYASFTDYPAEAVIKIPGEVNTDEIRTQLEYLYDNPNVLAEFAEQGYQYIKTHHDPARCAAAYSAAIHEFTARNKALSQSALKEAFAPYPDTLENNKLIASTLEHSGAKTFSRRNIFIDVSHIAKTDHKTGIQRIVREITAALYKTNYPGIEPVAVELIDGQLVLAKNWLVEHQLLTSYERELKNQQAIQFAVGDLFLMLDSSWERYEEFYPTFEQARAKRVPIVNVIYDLLPIRIPEYFVEGGPAWFENWFNKAIEQSDAFLCISAATANDVQRYLAEREVDSPPKVSHWHHGSDMPTRTFGSNNEALPNPLQAQEYLIMVGTIEPRKLHALAVDAMELLWQQGSKLKLCIAGKPGWMVEEFIESVRSHPRLNKQLVFAEDKSDNELAQLYTQAAGLLLLSKGEGLGLPLIEAASYGIPILCSDIPSFRELGQQHAVYTNAETTKSLANDIKDWHSRLKQSKLPDSALIRVNTCSESAEALLEALLEDLNL